MTSTITTTIRSCDDVVELLPWLVNGTLEGAERTAIVEHLASCEPCAAELEQTLCAWQIFGEHVPSRRLAEHALGLMPNGPASERIERHLASCRSCREESALVGADRESAGRVTRFEIARRVRREARSGAGIGRRPYRFRRLAMAAGVAAALTSALLWSLLKERPPGRGDETVAQTGEVVQVPEPDLISRETWDGRDRWLVPEPDDRPRTATIDLFADGFEMGSANLWTNEQERRAVDPLG